MDNPEQHAANAPAKRELPQLFYKGLLLISTVIWGSAFVVMKGALDSVTPSWLLAMRFGATALILIIVFNKTLREHLNRQSLWAGAVLGTFSFMGFWFQTIGLTDTTPGKNAFITATYCVMVPFLWWFFARRKPTVYNVVAAVMCTIGVGLLSLGDDFSLEMRWGDAMTLICALGFALHIVYVAKFSEKYDVMTITVVQIATAALLSLLFGLISEPLPPSSTFTLDFFLQLGYLVVFSSCLAMVFQNIGQAHVPPSQAALLLSLESVFGVVFSVLLYGEQLTATLVLGFILIFAAITISEMFPRK